MRAASGAHVAVERVRSAVASLEQLLSLPQVALRLSQVEVSDLLIVTLSRWKGRAPDHTFELALPGHEPTLLGDSELITQAIEGFIAWAAAHSQPGDIRVSLRPTGARDGCEDVIVSVRCPIGATDAPQPARLFERFAEPQADGAGDLELALSRAIAERHGGRVWAERHGSEPALTLSLALPSTPAPAAVEEPSASVRQVEPDNEPDMAHTTPPALARTRRVALVAHGDPRMSRYLRANLEDAAFSAKAATSLQATLKLIELEEPDLIILDLALPGENGRDPLARVLARTTAPVIALGRTAEPAACVAALDAGAADFIAQPLSVEETLARVRRALRPPHNPPIDHRQHVYTCGDLVLDDAQRLVTIGGTPTALSKTEYRLLRTLAQHAGKTLSHEALLAQVWGPAYSKEIEFIWVYIRRLRRKIEPDPAHPRYILTAPGIGYRLGQPGAS